jgi:hypothetical protein
MSIGLDKAPNMKSNIAIDFFCEKGDNVQLGILAKFSHGLLDVYITTAGEQKVGVAKFLADMIQNQGVKLLPVVQRTLV